MSEQIKKMKIELKALALDIKNKKKTRKSQPNGYVYGLLDAQIAFRHKHVAYCLARGLKLEQVDSGKNLNMAWVEWIVKSMDPESKNKLYVVVNEELAPSQQAVQAGHALAEFLRMHPNTQWSNGHLIYLKQAPRYGGDMGALYSLRYGAHQYAEFKEPDLKNKVTAYAVFGPNAEEALKTCKLV